MWSHHGKTTLPIMEPPFTEMKRLMVYITIRSTQLFLEEERQRQSFLERAKTLIFANYSEILERLPEDRDDD